MANDYVIITDSGSDLSMELAAEIGVRVVPLSYSLDGGEPLPGDKVDLKEFYAALRNGSTATTSAANLEDFTEIYRVRKAENRRSLSRFLLRTFKHILNRKTCMLRGFR